MTDKREEPLYHCPFCEKDVTSKEVTTDFFHEECLTSVESKFIDKREEAKPLTEEEIESESYKKCNCEVRCDLREDFIDAANWAKERSDAYWKESMLQEAEKAIREGIGLGKDLQYNSEEEIEFERKEYLTKIKEKYGI